MVIGILHKDTVLPDPTVEFDPDLELCQALADHDMMHVFTARIAGTVVGYLILVVAPVMFAKGTKLATQEGLYIHEDHRRGMLAARLIRTADGWLKDHGIAYVIQRVHKDVDYSPLLKRMGYAYTDATYTRRL